MLLVTIVGARPQFIKAAAVSRAIASLRAEGNGPPIIERIIHTGQHYDDSMSRVFFDELKIPRPAINLEVGSGPHGCQTARMLEKIERVLLDERPDWVLVYGDTNSTLAGALAAAKLQIPVAHVESGLRSGNRAMPEEINRIVADRLAALLFCPTRLAVENLAREGMGQGVHQAGDVMYDSVLFHAGQARQSSTALERFGLRPKQFYMATIHRAENTDDPSRLDGILRALERLEMPVLLPLHPRTRKILGERLPSGRGCLRFVDPLAYFDMLLLESHARIVLTDSGGVQKEAFWFRVPCVTLREETEWTELVESGVNRLAGASTRAILKAVAHFDSLGDAWPGGAPADLYGDGRSAERIVAILAQQPLDHRRPSGESPGNSW